MARDSSSSPSNSNKNSGGGDAKALQDRLHQLLKGLSETIELIKNWPESDGDDASIHVETTTKLISAVLEVIVALQRVEGVVKTDNALRKTLQDCEVPMDLLDLLDHGNGLNPDCFSRGLLREALGQLAGLKRRKLALEMLGSAVQKGLLQRDKIAAKLSKKRARKSIESNENDKNEGEPPTAKARVTTSEDINSSS